MGDPPIEGLKKGSSELIPRDKKGEVLTAADKARINGWVPGEVLTFNRRGSGEEHVALVSIGKIGILVTHATGVRTLITHGNQVFRRAK